MTGWHFALLLALSAPAAAADLILTTEPEDPPFSMVRDGEPNGLATTILKSALERSGVSYEIAVHPWLRAYDLALKTPNTCVYATTPTDQRRPWFKWVGPLVEEKWALFARSDSAIAIASLDEAGRYRIGGSQGAAETAYLQERGIAVEALNAVENMNYNLRKLLAGRIDLWATGLRRGSYSARLDGVSTIKPVLTFRSVTLFLACNRAVPDDIVARLNAALAAMRADGTMARLSAPYE
jgi:polar amino acid transport system substrate-binding protein